MAWHKIGGILCKKTGENPWDTGYYDNPSEIDSGHYIAIKTVGVIRYIPLASGSFNNTWYMGRLRVRKNNTTWFNCKYIQGTVSIIDGILITKYLKHNGMSVSFDKPLPYGGDIEVTGILSNDTTSSTLTNTVSFLAGVSSISITLPGAFSINVRQAKYFTLQVAVIVNGEEKGVGALNWSFSTAYQQQLGSKSDNWYVDRG